MQKKTAASLVDMKERGQGGGARGGSSTDPSPVRGAGYHPHSGMHSGRCRGNTPSGMVSPHHGGNGTHHGGVEMGVDVDINSGATKCEITCDADNMPPGLTIRSAAHVHRGTHACVGGASFPGTGARRSPLRKSPVAAPLSNDHDVLNDKTARRGSVAAARGGRGVSGDHEGPALTPPPLAQSEEGGEDGSSSSDADGQAATRSTQMTPNTSTMSSQSELDKRRDKRRRYRRRKRDRDLQEELVVRQQHHTTLAAPAPVANTHTPPTAFPAGQTTTPPATTDTLPQALDTGGGRGCHALGEGGGRNVERLVGAAVDTVGGEAWEGGGTSSLQDASARGGGGGGGGGGAAAAGVVVCGGGTGARVAAAAADRAASTHPAHTQLGDSTQSSSTGYVDEAGSSRICEHKPAYASTTSSSFALSSSSSGAGAATSAATRATSAATRGSAVTPATATSAATRATDTATRSVGASSTLPYGHGQGQGVGHNPAREDSCLWHFCPEHYDVSRPLYVRVCGLKAAIHIDERGVIWLNLSQLMKLVGKTKKQTLELYGQDSFDTRTRSDVKLLDLKDGPKASAYVSELRARHLVIPFMGPTKSTNFLAELDRIHREFKVPILEAYDSAAETSQDAGGGETALHTPLYLRFCNLGAEESNLNEGEREYGGGGGRRYAVKQ